MKKVKMSLILSSILFSMMLLGTNVKASEEDTVECKWGIEECHRVKDVDGITYVYHGIKVVENQE